MVICHGHCGGIKGLMSMEDEFSTDSDFIEDCVKVAWPGEREFEAVADLDFAEQCAKCEKIIEEFGSFNRCFWSFVNYKPIVSKFRYLRQVPIKTAKADVISKEGVSAASAQ